MCIDLMFAVDQFLTTYCVRIYNYLTSMAFEEFKVPDSILFIFEFNFETSKQLFSHRF